MSIHAVGDSWTCREGDTGLDRGWQAYALPAECRHGVSGSTAEEWATNHKGMCNRALAACSEGDVVIISLVGNDIRHAAEDGKITVDEIIAATVSLNSVVNKFRAAKCNVVLLKYCDPYSGHNVKAALGIFLMNTLVSGVAVANGCETLETKGILTEKTDWCGDFHPTESGHRKIAEKVGVIRCTSGGCIK